MKDLKNLKNEINEIKIENEKFANQFIMKYQEQIEFRLINEY